MRFDSNIDIEYRVKTLHNHKTHQLLYPIVVLMWFISLDKSGWKRKNHNNLKRVFNKWWLYNEMIHRKFLKCNWFISTTCLLDESYQWCIICLLFELVQMVKVMWFIGLGNSGSKNKHNNFKRYIYVFNIS